MDQFGLSLSRRYRTWKSMKKPTYKGLGGKFAYHNMLVILL